MSHKKIEWLDVPEKHDYQAALSYLSLHYPLAEVGPMVERLRAESMSEFKAKDILRASGLHALPDANSHVERNLEKIEDGEKLSPILLLRGEKLVVADGFHRLCAVYLHDEDALIPCKITGSLK